MYSCFRISFSIVFELAGLLANGTDNDTLALRHSETLMGDLFKQIDASRNDDQRTALADSIAQLLNKALQETGSFDYPFDSLPTMGKITSSDHKLRIYTWNLPAMNGINKYYGFLQYKTDKESYRIIQLNDKSEEISNPDKAALTADNWLGCLIYEIIEKKHSDRIYYTCLCYDPDGYFLSKKMIDVIWFNDYNEPVFGENIFRYKNQLLSRIIFEYSSRAQVSLRWNDSMNMIVFDHLSPSRPDYTGNFQYYGPDFSYDALKFEKGIWELTEDVDVRNSEE